MSSDCLGTLRSYVVCSGIEEGRGVVFPGWSQGRNICEGGPTHLPCDESLRSCAAAEATQRGWARCRHECEAIGAMLDKGGRCNGDALSEHVLPLQLR